LRAQFAFAAYGGARDLTKQYLRECQPDNPKVSRYLRAVNEWENVALQFQMVVEVFNKIESLVGSSNRVFCNGDDSPEDRLYFIANNVKHAAKKIAQRKASEAESLPLWLSNAGINSYEQRSVSFSEVAEILRDVGALADDLQNPNRPT
jgi:tRNA(Ser,Leu) C12 N-acetylase TAN1